MEMDEFFHQILPVQGFQRVILIHQQDRSQNYYKDLNFILIHINKDKNIQLNRRIEVMFTFRCICHHWIGILLRFKINNVV